MLASQILLLKKTEYPGFIIKLNYYMFVFQSSFINVKINEIMYYVWIAPLFIVGTLWGMGRHTSDKTHGKDGRRERRKGEMVKKCREHRACHPTRHP